MEIVEVHLVSNGVPTEVVGPAVHVATSDSSAAKAQRVSHADDVPGHWSLGWLDYVRTPRPRSPTCHAGVRVVSNLTAAPRLAGRWRRRSFDGPARGWRADPNRVHRLYHIGKYHSILLGSL